MDDNVYTKWDASFLEINTYVDNRGRTYDCSRTLKEETNVYFEIGILKLLRSAFSNSRNSCWPGAGGLLMGTKLKEGAGISKDLIRRN